MVTEGYVSFETAKLLKEKGFPQEYDRYHSLVYNEEDYEDEYEVQRMVLETRIIKAGTLSSYPIGVPDPKCYCPTLQMTMKWMREEKNLYIQPRILNDGTYIAYIYRVDGFGLVGHDKRRVRNSPEEACEAAIKYCLENLI